MVFSSSGAARSIGVRAVVVRPPVAVVPHCRAHATHGEGIDVPGDPSGDPPGVPGDTPLLWDPSSGTTTSIPGTGYDLFCSGHSFLADGRLLIAGGHTENWVGLRYASTYDPFANSWNRLPDMNAGRWYPTSTTLSNGDALVVSGSIDNTEGVNRLPQVFQAASGTWRDLTNALLGLDVYPHMHLAPNGKVFSVAPSDVTRYLDPAGTGAWSFVANRNSGFRDYGTSVLYDDGKVLHLGGGNPPTNAAEVIDLNQALPTWLSVASMAIARRQANATILPDGKVLVTGGTSGPGFNNTTTPVFEAEMWDPTTGAWSSLASAQIPRLYHSVAVLLPDGRIFSAGGNGYCRSRSMSRRTCSKGCGQPSRWHRRACHMVRHSSLRRLRRLTLRKSPGSGWPR